MRGRILTVSQGDRLIAAARERLREYPNIVGCSLGIKHARRYGYGDAPKLCVKVFVSRKVSKSHLSADRTVPKTISIQIGPRRLRLPTDVHPLARPVWHDLPYCFSGPTPQAQTPRGTPGFVVGSGQQSWMITAGHVFDKKTIGLPAGGQVWIGDSPEHLSAVGEVSPGETFFDDPVGSGFKRDVGVVKLPPGPPVLPAAMDRPPWTTIRSVVSFRTVRESVRTKDFLYCKTYGFKSQPFSRLETYETRPMDFGPGVGVYAPILVFCRADRGVGGRVESFLSGDSGAPIVDVNSNALVGIHVVATQAKMHVVDQPSQESWGILAASILDTLGRRLGPLRLI